MSDLQSFALALSMAAIALANAPDAIHASRLRRRRRTP
jgi:hypothetical protein